MEITQFVLYICFINLIQRKDTEMTKFKQEVLDKIKSDTELFAIVAKAMRIQPASLLANIHRNGSTLNQYHVVAAVAKYLKQSPDKLLEKEASEV